MPLPERLLERRWHAVEEDSRGVGTWWFADLDPAGNPSRHRKCAAEPGGGRPGQRHPGGSQAGEFNVADADELVRYATRRGLLGMDEGERILAEVHAAEQKRVEKAADRERAQRAKARAKAKPVQRIKPAKAVKKTVKAGRKK